MALYDNKYWLLSHIRNSFRSTDDTGMCQLIMSGEETYRKIHQKKLDLYPDPQESDSDGDTSSDESYDLQLDTDFGMMRYRSNTAAELEKMENLRKRTARIKYVKWEQGSSIVDMNRDKNKTNDLAEFCETDLKPEAKTEPKAKAEPKVDPKPDRKVDPKPEPTPSTSAASDDEELFQRRAVPQRIEPQRSLLAQNLKEHSRRPVNPFVEYAKWDGSGQLNMPVKKYKIFLTMLPEQERNYPMHVCCLAAAKIHELIGFILLKCSTQYTNQHWRPVHHYNLYITEEDGEVDRDFPHLDPKEQSSKFGFTCLGLVESTDEDYDDAEHFKTVNFDQAEPIELRRIYHEDGFFDLGGRGGGDMPSAASAASDRRSKEQAKIEQAKQVDSDLQLLDRHNKAMEAPLYKLYKVQMVNKMRTKQEVHLGVSADKIEIDIGQNSRLSTGLSKLSKTTKPTDHEMETIGGCEMVSKQKSLSKTATFKLIYRDGGYGAGGATAASAIDDNFKSYEFEAEQATVRDIVHKINSILELRPSDTRNEYLAMLERKRYRKDTA